MNKGVIPLLLLLSLATWFFYPGLFQGKSLVHGDNLNLGLPLLDLHQKIFSEGATAAWSNLIYGGHPLYAESQGGFSNPLNSIAVLLFEPVHANMVLRWLATILAALGVYQLCRILSASPLAAGFAALAACFSAIFIRMNTNLTATEALAFIPWMMWSMESWLKKPSYKTALYFGLCAAMMVFAGYPQFMHGTVVYLFVSLLVIPFQTDERKRIRQHLPLYVKTGACAVLIAVTISAVQWLPLLELVNHSHRQQGTDVLLPLAPEIFIRGLLFSNFIQPSPFITYFPVVSSVFLCFIASLVVVAKSPSRLKGHMIGAILLLNLGFGLESPLVNFIYQNHLIPGLHYFRMMWTYFFVGVIGVSVMAAFSIDAFTRTKWLNLSINSVFQYKPWIVAIIVAAWLLATYYYRVETTPPLHYLTLLVGIFTILGLSLTRVRTYIPLILLLLLTVEIVALRIKPFHFVDNADLDKTDNVKMITALPDFQDYKVVDLISSAEITFRSAFDEHLDQVARRIINSLSVSTNMLWGIASIDGNLALPLARRMLVEDYIRAEVINTPGTQAPGLRLMDFLGIRFIVSRSNFSNPFYDVISRDDGMNVQVMENPAAQPRFQFYTDFAYVDDAEQAFSAIKTLEQPQLLIETHSDSYKSFNIPIPATVPERAEVSIATHKASAIDYVFTIEANKPGWFFLADANYPGWKAELDGQQHEVYSAQVLGKAVPIPAGEHQLRIYFDSNTLKTGKYISLISVLIITVLGGIRLRYRHLKSTDTDYRG